MSNRLLTQIALAKSRRWYQPSHRAGAKYEMLAQASLRQTAAHHRQKQGRRIWWPKDAGVCCTAKHGFSRSPIAQVEGSLFCDRLGRRDPVIPFRRWRLDYDLPF